MYRLFRTSHELKISRSMAKIIKRNEYIITENTAFKEVIFNLQKH